MRVGHPDISWNLMGTQTTELQGRCPDEQPQECQNDPAHASPAGTTCDRAGSVSLPGRRRPGDQRAHGLQVGAPLQSRRLGRPGESAQRGPARRPPPARGAGGADRPAAGARAIRASAPRPWWPRTWRRAASARSAPAASMAWPCIRARWPSTRLPRSACARAPGTTKPDLGMARSARFEMRLRAFLSSADRLRWSARNRVPEERAKRASRRTRRRDRS